MAEITEFSIRFEWDAEAKVYTVTSPEVQGLIVEGYDLRDACEKVAMVLPHLAELPCAP